MRHGVTMQARAARSNCFSEWMPIIKIYGGKTIMLLKRRKMDLADMADLENAEAATAKNAANIDYIAMMADIEIPTEEGIEDAQPEV